MVDQGLLVLGRTDDFGAPVPLQLVDQPGADRVHPFDFGKIDDRHKMIWKRYCDWTGEIRPAAGFGVWRRQTKASNQQGMPSGECLGQRSFQ